MLKLNGESRNDFKHKIAICRKESQETNYWLKLISVSEEKIEQEAKILSIEAQELNLIFNAIINSTNKNESGLIRDKTKPISFR